MSRSVSATAGRITSRPAVFLGVMSVGPLVLTTIWLFVAMWALSGRPMDEYLAESALTVLPWWFLLAVPAVPCVAVGCLRVARNRHRQVRPWVAACVVTGAASTVVAVPPVAMKGLDGLLIALQWLAVSGYPLALCAVAAAAFHALC